MGYRIQAYSLDELRRISAPGAVVPSLFWLLPVGKWDERGLDVLWRQFTNSKSGYCHDLGLALLKDPQSSRSESTGPLDLSSLAAQLGDLLPHGVEEHLSRNRNGDRVRQFLLLSGAYPQPGWGLLVNVPQEPVDLFVERFVDFTIDRLRNLPHADEALHLITSATKRFHQLQAVEESPAPKLSYKHSSERLNKLRERAATLKTLQTALDNSDLVKLDTARRKLLSEKSTDLALSLCDEKSLAEFKLARFVFLQDEEKNRNLIALLEEWTTSSAELRSAYTAKARKIGLERILKNWAKLEGDAPAPGNLVAWATERHSLLLDQFKQEIGDALQTTTTEIGAVDLAILEAEAEYSEAMKRYDDRRRQARESFRSALKDALVCQWDWGPRFLVTAEALCRQDGIDCRSIAWDPARMVGWKVWALGVSVTVEDLHVKTQSLIGEEQSGLNLNGDQPATGSYFTDYVHYVASADLQKSPRDVTVTLLAKLIRPNEMRRLFSQLGEEAPVGLDEQQVANLLVTSFGWLQGLTTPEYPLIKFIKQTGATWIIINTLAGNEIRIAAESFCKDLIDLVATELGYPENELWTVLLEKRPDYDRTGKPWAEEIAAITLGPAKMILEALLPLIFPEKTVAVDHLIEDLRLLANSLNPPSHHQEDPAKQELNRPLVASIIHRLLDTANELVGEMPWHFTMLQSTGVQPSVLTGKAWSHSHPEERMIRVLLWTGESIGRRALIWNQALTNPIMTDPRVLKRPSSY